MKKHDGTALKKSVRIICEDDKGQGKVLKEKDQQQRKPLASPPPTSSQDGSKPRRKSSLEIVHKLQQKGTPPPAAQAAAAPTIAAETGVADANTPVTVTEAADAAASSATAAITSGAAADHSDKEPAVLASHTAAFEIAPSITNSRTPRASTDMLDSSNISTATASMSSAGDAVTATAGSNKNDAVSIECTTSTLPAVEVCTQAVDDSKADAIVAATCTVTPKRPSVGQEMLAKQRNTFANFSRTVKPRYALLI
jgi:hypothetical protein